jgi:NADP-dependent 3-hydroxy acid dehydrogenase YdfG
VARRADKLEEIASSIAKSYPSVQTFSVPTDIADPVSVATLFEKVKEKYGHADVLVNNAGIFKAIAPVKDVDQALWWEEMVNIFSLLLLLKYWHILRQIADTQYPGHLSRDTILSETASHPRHTSKDRDTYYQCSL